MTRTDLSPLLREQHGVAAAWQLRALGLCASSVAHWARSRRRLHRGVFVDGHGPVTPIQRLWAAAVTSPRRRISHRSAGTTYGFDDWLGREVFVTGEGSGGSFLQDGLVVFRSLTVAGHTTTFGGLPITTPARTLIDLATILEPRPFARAVREALRLGCVTCPEIQVALDASPRRKRPRRLAALAAQYASLPINRCRSDPESYALALFAAAGIEPPLVNTRINGEETDFWWPRHRHVIELDGGRFHQFPDEDARKTSRWRDAAQTVDRFPSADVYTRPAALLALVPPGARARDRPGPISGVGSS